MVHFNDRIVARFLQATLLWGTVGLIAGIYAAWELLFIGADAGIAYLNFGRLRPVHSHLMLYAFAGNAFFSGLYYALQRLCSIKIWSDKLAYIHFWVWQFTMLAAAMSLIFGYSQGRAYAEMEWPFDLLFAGAWLLFMINAFVTLKKRQVRFLFVSLWFFIAALLGVALLHVCNAIAWPVSLWKSYPLYSGLVDASIQAWYSRNIQVFMLIIPFLGLMYYFVPKIAQKPVYSYRLAVLHFWSLIFLQMWTGSRELYFTALPEWLQSLGVIAGIMLWAPHWGGVINGLCTIGKDWPSFRQEPALKFFALALLSYGVVSVGELLTSFKSVHLFLQHSDWMIAQTHLLAMGWLSSSFFGLAYYLVPKLWGRPLYSKTLAQVHFWITLISLLLFVGALAAAGINQSLKWLAMQDGGLLLHPQFLSTQLFLKPFHQVRMIGGILFFLGALLAAFNCFKTARSGQLQADYQTSEMQEPIAAQNVWGRLETRVMPLSLLILLVIMLGGTVQLIPLLSEKSKDQTQALVKPYSPLEWHGRDIYIREGCVSCHTQSVRWTLKEELRYGPPTQSWELIYDRPALFGHKRTGPDLQKIGRKYPDSWLFQHLLDPRIFVPGSTMPAYPWLRKTKSDLSHLPAKILVLQRLGMNPGVDPLGAYHEQAKKIQSNVENAGFTVETDAEVLALIAYLQRLGTAGKIKP